MARQRATASIVSNPADPTTAEPRIPRHRQVFETLLGDIASGRFQPGDAPTEAELAKTFSASRSTIARAMRELKAAGCSTASAGGGTHITRHDRARRSHCSRRSHKARPASDSSAGRFTRISPNSPRTGPTTSAFSSSAARTGSPRADARRRAGADRAGRRRRVLLPGRAAARDGALQPGRRR